MAVNGVTTAGTTTNALGTAASNSVSGILQGGESQFLQLLVAQLQNQDPLNPVSATDFTSQLAQFATVDSIAQLNTNFSTQLLLQELSQGSNLIGKNISYVQSGSSNLQQGTVSSIQINNGQLQLTVGQNAVTLDQVRGILPNS
ncbi:MAG TPA: flagellar hook capping FlgD N-terminal domain-containing protein [Gemmataceae bacterium]|nr:flagellar hook capping FlgD N-terminal domain-containing protein [Gemmataceae bacterium]